LPKFDTESTKTVGLAEQILRERARPRCDVFWNNEVLHTVRLAQAGVLQAYASPEAAQYPASARAADNRWFGFAARVRVLLVNSQRVAPSDEPKRIEELTLPRWRGQVGIAKPLFGTTATHVACLFVALGPEKAKALLRNLKANDIRVLPGNKHVAVQVGSGELAMGLTDTDDALAEVRAKRPVRLVYLDHGPDELGLLLLPNTVSVIQGAPQEANARRLVDFLLSRQVEKELARGESGQVPLHAGSQAPAELGIPVDARYLAVDYSRVAAIWDEAMDFVKDEFTAP
jgi:iron(III) transport system substrate-binding protein